MGAATPTRYTRAAWGFVAYTVFVIVWGAVVRATLSGDGCGDHWPLCNGEAVPLSPSVETLIEFGHRLTSGLAWIGALAFFVVSRRRFDPTHPARRAAFFGWVFMTTEALIGAGLVLTRMVADNPDTARGYWAAAHLLNTFALLSALTLHARYSADRTKAVLSRFDRRATLGVFILLGIVGATGAIAALGDTLFPARDLASALAQDVSSEAHIFLRLRTLHPVFALAASAGAAVLGSRAWFGRVDDWTPHSRWGAAVAGLAITQVVLGFLNVLLLAPIWMQLVHLVVADALWIALVMLMTSPRPSSR